MVGDGIERQNVIGPDSEPQNLRLCTDVEHGPVVDPRHWGVDLKSPWSQNKMADVSNADARQNFVKFRRNFDVRY